VKGRNASPESNEVMKAVISVANIAARVGKTTTAVHLAAELALRGYDTVLIDADPQATERLVEPDWVKFSVADVLIEPEPSRRFLPGERNISLAEVLAPTSLMSLHVAPSTIRLAAVEGDTAFNPHELNLQLRPLDTPCDFAVIDTPSSLGPISAACLSASTHLLVPVTPRGQGVLGLRHLVENIEVACGHGEVRLLGVVCNLFECRSHSSGEFYEELKRGWGDQVFETIIHRDNLVEGCAGHRLPVQTLAPESTAATLYSRLADEVITRLPAASRGGRLTTMARAARILLVEDDKLVMGIVRETLESEGWEVVCCEDGAKALRQIESGKPYDLIFTDNDLPGVSGLELIRRARALPHRRLTPIIMFSAGLHHKEARHAGADEFLRKPEDIRAIAETVRLLLATSRQGI
jgi:chromosome partitioning protein